MLGTVIKNLIWAIVRGPCVFYPCVSRGYDLTVRTIFCGLIFLLVSNAGETQNAPRALTPLTVCEVLDDLASLRGKRVAILGRLDCEWNPTDHASCLLVEDHCARPFVVRGHSWQSQIYLNDWREKAPHTRAKVNDLALATKLQSIQESARLGMHKEWVGQVREGEMTWGWSDVADEWGVAYGQIVFAPELKPNPRCAIEGGCQAYERTPVSLIMDWHTLTTFGKERLNGTK